MKLNDQESENIRHLIRCLSRFTSSDEHGKMINEDTLQECEMKGITDKDEKYKLYKTNLFESQRTLHALKTNFYTMLDELESQGYLYVQDEVIN